MQKCQRNADVRKLTNVLKVQEEAKFPGLKQFKGKVMEVKVENNGLFSMWLRSRSQVLCFSGQELFSLWPERSYKDKMSPDGSEVQGEEHF